MRGVLLLLLLLPAAALASGVERFQAYLRLAEDEGNAWGKLGDALARLGDADAAADAYLSGIDQAEKFMARPLSLSCRSRGPG